MFQPSYIDLYHSGELESRARWLESRLESCDLCPRECKVDRTAGEMGFCRSDGNVLVASYCDHHGEEPVLSGSRGSGTIFFAHCALRCVFCQNHQISQPQAGTAFARMGPEQLAECMMHLQKVRGCHNINLVSPTHFLPQIVRAVTLAVPMGLAVPLVYNTNGYDSLAALENLDGVVDVYLPDLKYSSEECARKFSQASGYVRNARQAIREMYRQVGNLIVDSEGVAVRGLIVRHLVLPNGIAGSPESLAWLAQEISPDVAVSLMAQYKPSHRAGRVPLLSRTITAAEYAEARAAMEELGMENGWVQEMDAPDSYSPDFGRQGHPFEPDDQPQ